MQIINALQLRTKLGEILDKVYSGKGPIIISRLNKPLVAMISINQYYDYFSKEAERLRRKKGNQALEAWRKKYGQSLTEINFTAEIRKLRDSR